MIGYLEEVMVSNFNNINPRALCSYNTRAEFLSVEGPQEESQGEWMPKEMMEPMENAVRAPFDWGR